MYIVIINATYRYTYFLSYNLKQIYCNQQLKWRGFIFLKINKRRKYQTNLSTLLKNCKNFHKICENLFQGKN